MILVRLLKKNPIIQICSTSEVYGNVSKSNMPISENSSYQIAALITAIKIRSNKNYGNVILFAGGGTNSASSNYSSYKLYERTR